MQPIKNCKWTGQVGTYLPIHSAVLEPYKYRSLRRWIFINRLKGALTRKRCVKWAYELRGYLRPTDTIFKKISGQPFKNCNFSKIYLHSKSKFPLLPPLMTTVASHRWTTNACCRPQITGKTGLNVFTYLSCGITVPVEIVFSREHTAYN
jgi:hypothetical protein